MLLYAFYNVDLINITKGKSELSTGFVDDCTFVAIADDLDNAHAMLKNIMECTDRGLDWLHSHNSPFELLKLAVMDFTRTSHDTATSPLRINKSNPNGTFTTYTISTIDNYKYLGVIFSPKLKWRAHVIKVITSTSWWIHQLWRISKTTGGLSPSKTHQLYNTVAVPAFTYTSDIWYTPPHSSLHTAETPKNQLGPPSCYN